MSSPLVSVICLCYNHERFVQEAINSVLRQTYNNIELIVVDDCSGDNSHTVIERTLKPYQNAKYIALTTNMGNCSAFNLGWHESKGEFIIDLAADDVLLPQRIEKGVEAFRQHSSSHGVDFCNAELIAENGAFIRCHYEIDANGKSLVNVPQGDIFLKLIQRYFICPPTMMFRREVLDHLGGYDESLSYEDFDFWIRSSREFKYIFSDDILVKKRVVKGSKGQKQFKLRSQDLFSTYKVCAKAKNLVRNTQERLALKKRIHYELRQSLRLFDINTFFLYLKLLKNLN